MQLTTFALWLNQTFFGFDNTIFSFAHWLHEGALGPFLNVFFGGLTHLGDRGIFFVLLSLALLCFKKTRICGFAMMFAILIGWLATNLCMKNWVARPRPYTDITSTWYSSWKELGQRVEPDFSFPSGHATVSFDAMVPLFWFNNRKWSWAGLVLAFAIAFSRIYLFVHYPSDVLGGILMGCMAGVLGILAVTGLYQRWQKRKRAPEQGTL